VCNEKVEQQPHAVFCAARVYFYSGDDDDDDDDTGDRRRPIIAGAKSRREPAVKKGFKQILAAVSCYFV